MKNDEHNLKDSNEDRPFTFKITKRRTPWTSEEDQAISVLVKKHGTGNWTLIANEMSNTYQFKNRSGKQCRERWHNHLDPNINKDYWSEKEENILFMKHIEYGNKWSDIAKFLPGRTDNAIKNHFYSKLRKFIRKILKLLNKDNLLKNNNIDVNKYNSDKVYKIIKKFKIPYNTLTKDSILNLIINFDKNSKNGKIENSNLLLKQKTPRKKSSKERENFYSEKINKRKNLNNSKGRFMKRDAIKAEDSDESEDETENEIKELDSSRECNNDVYSVKIKKKGRPMKTLKSKANNETNGDSNKKRFSVNRKPELPINSLKGGKRFSFANRDLNNYENNKANHFNIIINKSILRDDIDENETFDENEPKKTRVKFENYNVQRNGAYISPGHSLVNSTRNINNVNKQFKFNYEALVEPEKNMLEIQKDSNYDYSNNQDFSENQGAAKSINRIRIRKNLNIDTTAAASVNPTLNPYTNKNYQDYFAIDTNKPLISPINYHSHMFPVSTKNYFNINMDPMLIQNFLETPTNMGAFTGSFRIQAGGDSTLLNQLKEINMHDKILINETENEDFKGNVSLNENTPNAEKARITPKFKTMFDETVLDTHEKNFNKDNNINNIDFSKCNRNNFNDNYGENNNNYYVKNENADENEFGPENSAKRPAFNIAAESEETISTKQKDSSAKRFSLDLDVVNQSDTKKIFSETINSFKNDNHIHNFNSNFPYAYKCLKTFAAQPQDNSSPRSYQDQGEYGSPNFNNVENANFNFQKDISKINILNCNKYNYIINHQNLAAAQQENKKVIFSTVNELPFNRPNMNNLFDASGKFPINLISDADLSKLRHMDEQLDVNTNNNFNNVNNNAPSTTPRNIKMEILEKYNKIIPMISPSRASLNISPKSAFVFNKKLFN